MHDSRKDHPGDAQVARAHQPRVPRMAGEMHDNVPVWSDPCCCCEAEPYWREVAEELGIDLDGDDGTA